MKLAELLKVVESHWPLSLAEEWDNPGLVCGDSNQVVKRVLLTVDVTSEVLDEAIRAKADLILAHHPFILKGVKNLALSTAKGSVIAKAIKADVAIYAAHTNADNASDGVSETLAELLSLLQIRPLVEVAPGLGAGRIGNLVDPTPIGNIARHLAQALPATTTGVRVTGEFNSCVRSVAVCGGAGDSLVDAAYEAGADVYITADLRHHVVQETLERAKAEGRDFAFIDVSHWASEWMWLEVAAKKIKDEFEDLSVLVSDTRTDPWTFLVAN